jgi:phosphoesterase RecJ-like protein
MTLFKLPAIVKKYQSFLISSHRNPDGDCIGSQLAMYWYLKSLGKSVTIFNADPVPEKLTFLKNASKFVCKLPKKKIDAIIILDASNPTRLGWDIATVKAPIVLNVDHHGDNTKFALTNIVDHKAAATGEILYRLFAESKISYPPEVAQALYTAMLTDTGGFRFSNVSPNVLTSCARLIEAGADAPEAYRQTYASFSAAGLRMRSKIWSTLQFYEKDRICIMKLPTDLYSRLGANYGDSEGMADFTLSAVGVEIGILIKYSPTETHFSLRSNGRIDVGIIARSFAGGGGHSCAAGCTIQKPLKESKNALLRILSKELKKI